MNTGIKNLFIPNADCRHALEDDLFTLMHADKNILHAVAYRTTCLAITVIRTLIGTLQLLLVPVEWAVEGRKDNSYRYLFHRSFHSAASNVYGLVKTQFDRIKFWMQGE